MKYLTPGQAALRLSLTADTVRHRCNRGHLATIHNERGHRLIPESEVRRALREPVKKGRPRKTSNAGGTRVIRGDDRHATDHS